MAAIGYVFTISRVAEMLGEDEGWLHELSIDMFPSTDAYGILRRRPGDDSLHRIRR